MIKIQHKSYLFAFALIFLSTAVSAYSVAEIVFNKLKSNVTKLLHEHDLEQGLFFMPPPPSGSISVRVNTSSDDAEQNLSNNSVSTNNNDLEFVQDGTVNQQTGMRFNGITIPKGAIITSAYIEFISKTTNSGTIAVTLSGQAIDNAPTFTTGTSNISSRTKTTATVAWSPANWTTTGAAYQTADISNIIQEIVNRSGWSSGNSLVIMATGPTTATRTAQSYDGVPASAPLLVVNYALVEICGNGLDDDGDGQIDGADLDCGTFCPTGSLSLERWLNIGGSAVSDLTGNANYPNNPSQTATLTSFDGPDNFADNYGTRVRGYITPSSTGIYSFNLTSDDASELYLSTDADPADKVLIASVSGYTSITEYTKYSSQTSVNLTLVAGQNYYVELLQKEGGGEDHFQVYWKTPSSSTWTIVPGTNLRPFGCVEICSNGVDDDGDGLVDAADTDCGTFCATGKINLQRWLSISGTIVSDLTGNANYPNNPTESTTLTSFDSPDDYADNFGQRARGYITPTQTGIYTFNLTSDDAGELYLSTDANPSNKKLIASVSGWTNTTEYTKYTSQTSYSILLNAGRNYYVEVLNKEGSGGDHFQVYWKTPSNTASWTIVPGTNLRPYTCSEICGNGVDDDGDGFTDCNCDLMTNGEFDNGLTGWGMYIQSGSSATGAIDNTSQLSGVNSGAVTISSASGTDWHIQAYQAGLSLQSGKTYTISFQSKSTGNRTMGVVLQQSISPYTVYWSQTVNLTTSTGTFTFDFPCTITNNGQVSLLFNMGQSNKKIWIDKISVTPKCAVEICGNNIDDDGNGLTDCADNACPVPTTSISGTNTICNGGSTTLTATGGGTYAWSNGTTGSSITISPATSTTYTVTVTNSSACTVTASQLVTVNTLPTASIAGTNSICPGASTTLTASGGGTYVWSTGATTAAITVTPASTATYIATVTNASGCTATASRTVTVNTNPTASISGTNTICAGASTTLTAAGGATYIWNTGATTAAITISPATTTTYTATVTNASGCTATASSTVTVNPVPSASISGTNTICAGGSTTLTASGGGTYVWNTGATTAAITISPATTTTYTATVTNASGCTATASSTVTVNPVPTASISGTNTICAGGSTTLTAGGGGTYVWNTGATTAAITIAPATTTTYTATVTNASGCTVTASSTVMVNTSPTAAISGTNTICAGASTTLTASGGGTYAWSTGATTAAVTVTPATTTTYTVTVTLTGGCTATATRTVTVNSNPVASVSGTNTICAGASTTLTASGGGTYVWNTGATTAAITISPATTTTYTATVTNASGCTATASSTVTVNPVPTASISGTNTICAGVSTTLTASGGGTYNWNTGATTAAVTVTPATTTTYTVTVTLTGGCTATATRTVTVNSNPAAGVSGTNTICAGASTTLTASGGGTYAWSTGATTAAITISPATTTTYTATVTNASGCTATASSTVTVNLVPAASISGTNTICAGGSTTLTASGGGTYVWSTGATTAAITISPATTTTYTATVTNASGCTATASSTVTVNLVPAASISGTNTICAGGSTTLTASGGGTYVWNTGATTAAITISPATTTTYTATVTNASGCTATASSTVTVNPVPAASISGTNTICAGGSTTLTASGGGTYVWNTGATTAAITISPATTTTYTATVTSASGCTATATSTVTVNTSPTAAISGTNTICAGASTTLTASGGGTYAWNTGATTAAVTVTPATTTTYTVTVTLTGGCTATATRTVTVNSNPVASVSGTNTICAGASTTLTASGGGTYVWNTGATTAAITISPATTTTYTATVTNASGCTATASSTVTVNPVPTASISGTNSICTGGSTTLTASGGGTYVWSTGATTAAITISPATTTTYTVTVTSASGCTATASRTVTVNGFPTASIAGTNTICAGGSTTLTASGGTSYAWSNGASTAAITVSPTATTTYTATVTNAGGCTATATRTVTVNASPTASISGINTICNGTSTTLTASGGGTYAWSNGATTAAITVNPTSTTTYSVVVTNASSCTASAASTVTVNTCTEICNNSTDDDGDGLVDCADPDCKRITLATPVVSGCINQPLQDVATVSVQVSWINAPANDQIEVSIYGQTERINTGAGVTSPQTVTFTVPANGATNKTITAAWRNATSLCTTTTTYNAPAACSSDQVGCNILYLSGLNKPADGDAWDNGLLTYFDEINGSNTVVRVLTKADASGMGTYNINSPSTPITVNLNSYSLVVISATTETSIAPALVTALKNYTGAVMNSNYDIIDDLGMSASAGSYQLQSNLYIDNTVSKEIYNFNNDINPSASKIFTRGNYTNAADSYLWTNAGEQSSGTNGAYFVYSTSDAMPGVAVGHGRRVYLGYHMDGVYANAQNGGALPAPVSSYFVPATHLTLEGKYYLDLAILEATKACNAEICNNGIDDNDNGLVDCQETVCGLPVISNATKTNATNCPGQNNGQITVTASGSNLEYSVTNGATYQASNVFTGLAVGTYNVRVRNSVTGCYANYASNPIQITGITCLENCTNGIDDDGDGLADCLDNDCKPTANAGTDANICLGATSTLSASASGGTGPYTYTWDNGLGSGQTKSVTPLLTTTYTVTISSAGGCTSTDAVTVNVTPCSEICTDGIDNDADGLVDCADPDCIVTATPHLANDVYQACPGIIFQEQPTFNDNNLQNPVYSIYSNPLKGSASINNQGVFTYTPNNSSCGVDSFRYQVCNAVTGCCDHATVLLNFGDHVAPILQNVPADITINCGEPVPAAPVVFGVDSCPGIFVNFNEVNNQGNAGSCQQYTIVRTWTATDQCGNLGTSKQTITVKDSDAPEVFRVYTLANGKRLLAGVTSNGQTSWKHIKFPITFNETPIVFAQIISNTSPEPVIARLRNIDQEGFELKIQEEEVADGIHNAEQVAWMAMEQGKLTDESNLQAGLLTNVTQDLKLLSYPKAYTASPVIIASTQTNVEADPIQIRFSNATSTSTQLKLEEEQSKDVEVVHANETVAYVAVKAGNIVDEAGDFIGKGGTVTLDNNWKLIQFDRKFMKPVVLFGGQPSGDDPATIRVRNVTATSFEARIQEWQYLNGTMLARTVSYYVVEGSIPAYVENPCSETHAPIVPGINLFSTDNCDSQVAMDFAESSVYTPDGMIYTKIWVSSDDCGNTSTLIRNDTCKMAAVRLRAIIAGSMLGTSPNANLMRDNLRTKGFVPLMNPYTLVTEGIYAQPTTHTILPSMLQVTGANAVVDWILVEIRDSLDSKHVIKSVPCLLQRDGDIVTEAGSDIIPFRTIPEGKYYVYIKHRNHVGMISTTPVYLRTYDVPLVDFSVYGNHVFNADNAGQKLNGKYYNWAGDLNNDNKVIYQGPNNDVFTLFAEVMVAPDNGANLANFIVTGYKDTDINLDGNSIFQGPGNDRSLLLLNTVLAHPANTYLLANFIAGISLP